MRRERIATAWLAVLAIGQVLSFAVSAYYASLDRLRLVPFGGAPGWIIRFVLLCLVLWSLESIGNWNKAGFTLYVICCAFQLLLNLYAVMIGASAIGIGFVAPFVSPLLLWAVLRLGSPSTWQQMTTFNLLNGFRGNRADS